MKTLDKRLQYLPILRALDEFGGSAKIRELNDRVSDILELSDQDLNQTMLKQNETVFEYRAGWARTDLKIAGLIDNPSIGLWAINSSGRECLNVSSEELIGRVTRELQRSRKMAELSIADEIDTEESSDDKQDWIGEVLTILRELDPGKFERLCQRILRESGFDRVTVTNSVHSGDGGIDGQGELRINQLLSFKVLFQCKRYSAGNRVGASAIRDFRGAMQGRADKGLFITTSFFSREAEREAVRDGVPNIELVDGNELCRLLKDLGLGVKTVEIGEPEIKFFEDI